LEATFGPLCPWRILMLVVSNPLHSV